MMYCFNCGTLVPTGEAECPTCNTVVAGGGKAATGNIPNRTSQAVSIEYLEAARQRDQLEYAAATCRAEAGRLQKSLHRCSVTGAIFGLICFACAMCSADAVGLPGVILAFFVPFFIPFGIAPVMHWLNTHSWFFIFNWIIMLLALYALVLVSIVAGPFYLIRARNSIKQNISAAEAYEKQARNLMSGFPRAA